MAIIRKGLNRIAACALGCLVILAAVPAADAAGPNWMPGFPMRAGNVVLGMWIPVPGATEYKVLRKVEGKEYTEIYKGPMPNFSDPGLDTSLTYVYKVIPIVGGKEGEPSPEGIVKGQEKIKPPQIGGVLPSPEGIQLRWNPVQGAAFYNLYRAEGKGAEFKLLKSMQDTSYFDKEVKPGNVYRYQIAAVDRMSIESDKSPAVEAVMEKDVKKAVKKPVVVKKVRKVGEYEGERLYEFEKPGSAAFSPGGEIYVAEWKGIQVLNAKGEYQRRIKFPPEWSEPFGLFIEKEDNLVMAFPYEGMVRVISGKDGSLIRAYKVNLPKELAGTPMVSRPGSCTFDGEGNLWVSDSPVGQLIVYDREGNEIGRVGRLRKEYQGMNPLPPDAFPGLGTIKYNPYDGKIYAILSVDAWIKVIDPKTKKVVGTYGGLGGEVEQFSGAAGFGFRKNGNILVFDNLMSVVKEFSPTFEYVQSYGDQLDKSGNPSFSMPGSGWMTFKEEEEKFLFASKLSNKVFLFETVR